MANTRAYCDGKLIKENFPVTEVSDFLAMPGAVVWVDYCKPCAADMEELQTELGFHELAVDDALGKHQRPKVDHYPNHLFLSCHAVALDGGTGVLAEAEVDAFINERWLVTVRKDEGFPLGPLLHRWNQSPGLAVHGVSFLLYGLLDLVIDGYFQPIDSFNDYYDAVSDSIFDEQPIPHRERRHWFDMRRALIKFHRLVLPMREVVSALMRHEQSIVPEALYPYYQDVYDHVLRATESTEALRDLVSTIVETNLSLRDYHTNQIMKKVTSWAAIIAVPTLITGWYGMNVPYPGFARHAGVVAATVLIIACSGGLYILFRRKEWL